MKLILPWKILIYLSIISTCISWQPVRAETDSGASITVNTTEDSLVVNENCSLREAIQAANSNSPVDACPPGTTGTDVIVLASSIYSIASSPAAPDENSGDFDIASNLIIQGQGTQTIIDGTAKDRIFQIFPGATVTIQNLRISGGFSRYSASSIGGGAIYNQGNLTIKNVSVYQNTTDYTGGGIDNRGVLNLDNVSLKENYATLTGGGIFNSGTQLTITNTTFDKNNAVSNGGALDNSGTAVLINVTINDNTSASGGGIYNDDSISLTNVTLAENNYIPAANFVNRGTATIVNTLFQTVSGNANCANTGTVTSLGYNLSNDGPGDNSCGLTQPTDQVNKNANLGPLMDNGGSTQTRLIDSNSPAVDRGDNSLCPAADQRGIARPFDGNSDGIVTCDIGAVELPSQNRVFLPLVKK